MGWRDALKAFANAVDSEYDRRIRSASNVKAYVIGGRHSHAGHGHAGELHGESERLAGEGGALGPLQANAGPHLEPVEHDHE